MPSALDISDSQFEAKRVMDILREEWWRILSCSLLIIIGTICSMNVRFEGVPEKYNLLQGLYRSLQLFTLGGRSLPVEGQWYYFYPLIAVFFLAPLFTIQFFISVIDKLIYNPERGIHKYRSHIIIGGLGKVGNTLFENLEKKSDDLVIIEKSESCKYLYKLRSKKVRHVVGDIAILNTMSRANAGYAKLMIAVTGDDIANIDAAANAQKISKGKCSCLIQVKDHYLSRNIMVAKLFDPSKVITINLYETVAKEALKRLGNKYDFSAKNHLFVVVGIGNFGKMLVKILLETDSTLIKSGENKLVVIDKHPKEKDWTTFSSFYDLSTTPVDYVEGDVRDPGVWQDLKIRYPDKNFAIVLAMDNDVSNVNSAIYISEKIKAKVFIITRLFRNVKVLQQKNDNIEGMVFSDIAINEINTKINELT